MNSTSTAGLGMLTRQLYQIWRALRDPSIPWAAKWLIPIAALVYWISPIDLIPLFPLDDIVVVALAANMFIQMLSRYQRTATGANQGSQGRSPDASESGKTIETTWRVVEE